jgi:hypothetical protein
MRFNFTRHLSITRLAVLALLALFFIQAQTRLAQATATITPPLAKQNDDEIITLAASVLGGLARGQTLRFTLFNPRQRDSQLPLRAQVKLFDAQGRVIAESAEVAILPGEFCSLDFNRNNLLLAGEEGTGRLQVRGTIRIQERRDVSEARGNQIPTAVEVVDNRTGATVITTATAPYAPIIIA